MRIVILFISIIVIGCARTVYICPDCFSSSSAAIQYAQYQELSCDSVLVDTLENGCFVVKEIK